MRALFISFVIAFSSVGCAGSPFSFENARQVKIGMTESEVTTLLGTPYSVLSRDNEQLWIWSYTNLMVGDSRVVSYVMKDGRVSRVPTIPGSFK
jgi:hypothetical protein